MQNHQQGEDEEKEEIKIEKMMNNSSKNKRKEERLSCMLNTEVNSVLAVMRRPSSSSSSDTSSSAHQFRHVSSFSSSYSSDDHNNPTDYSLIQRFKTLRTFIFDPPNKWRYVNPSEYLSPFLEIIQADNVPAAATGIALSSIIKILHLNIFDLMTPGAANIMNSIVVAVSGCRVEKIDKFTEEAVLVRILFVLVAIMKHEAHVLLSDHSVCTVIFTCFQIIKLSVNWGDLLQRSAGHTMVELISVIYSRISEIEVAPVPVPGSEQSSLKIETEETSGFGIKSAVDIFQFLCSLLNVVPIGSEIREYSPNANTGHISILDVQNFTLLLINSAIELSGENIGMHPKLLGLVQDELFHHFIGYDIRCNPLILSTICSTVLNIYHLLRRSVRLQLEAFFTFFLFKTAKYGNPQIQEVTMEGIMNFIRQPTFTIEMYVNYDCSVSSRNIFEETSKLICRNAFPVGVGLTSLQLQSFECLAMMIHNIANNVDKEDDFSSSGPYPVEIITQNQGQEGMPTPVPFWEEISKEKLGLEKWINVLRINKAQKKRLQIAGYHFNQDYQKGLDYIKLSGLVFDSSSSSSSSSHDLIPNPKAYAMFFRYTPGLDKNMIGNFFGDPEEFNMEVLQEFANTFEFSGMLLDAAMRCFLETFRLPGEAQKIARIVEIFSGRFYEQSTEIFATKDAVYVLVYSVIMLNTDLHNPQVKKKMTEEEFVKNNRSINGGKDLPREYLLQIFSSIASKPFSTFDQPGTVVEMEPYRWAQLINQSKVMKPFVVCDFDRRLGRDMFAAISGPSISTVAAIFEHSDDENIIHECVETLFSIARIAQYQLEDSLDELICVFCKFTTLLNPYASSNETLFAFSHDMKPRIAILAVFNIANTFKDSIRGSWRNIIDCLLKLKKLKLLPSSTFDPDNCCDFTVDTIDSDGGKHQQNDMIGRYQDFGSMESTEESFNFMATEFEQNVQIIQQCHIESIFRDSSGLEEESLLNLGRYLILAAGGKGQKFSTPVEEEQIVAFCWDLITTIAYANAHRFSSFWPHYHEYMVSVSNFPLFSPIPFAEKAIVAQVKICLKLFSMNHPDKMAEELIFKSIALMCTLEKEILGTCSDILLNFVSKIVTDYPGKVQSKRGWESILQLISQTGRHSDSYNQRVEALISLLSHDKSYISPKNYEFCLETAFDFIQLKHSSVNKNIKIMDLLCETVKSLVHWHRNQYSDPDSNTSVQSAGEEMTYSKGDGAGDNAGDDSTNNNDNSSNNIMNLFVKLGNILRLICLSRREEVRNYAVTSIEKIITSSSEGIFFTPENSIFCFKMIVFPMVDDIYEKILDYTLKCITERVISMENTLKIATGVMTEVYLELLKPLSENPQFRLVWMGILKRMENHVKLNVGDQKQTQEFISNLLKKITDSMKENELLIPRECDNLWELTYVQIQRILPIPSLVQEFLT